MSDALDLALGLEASWPPERVEVAGGCRVRVAPGGGSRVNSILPISAPVDAEAAETRAEALGVAPVWQLWTPPTIVDFPKKTALLGATAFRATPFDETVVLLRDAAGLAPPSRPAAGGAVDDPRWPPLGLAPARMAILARAAGPKAALFVEDLGAVFASVGDGVCFLHALEVAEAARRRGIARDLIRAAGGFAEEIGVRTLCACVVAANAPARALFEGLGFAEAARYAYWRAP